MNTKLFQIKYDSPLGVKVKQHLELCLNVNNQTANFILGLGSNHPKLGFPTLTDEQARLISYESNDNFEAGGFIAISIPASIFDQIHYDPDLWSKVMIPSDKDSDNEDPRFVYLCPRVTIVEVQWMHYRQALSLNGTPEWRFSTDNNKKSQYFGKPVFYRYENVKNRILPDNRKELAKNYRSHIVSDKAKICVGFKFGFKDDMVNGKTESIKLDGDREEKLLLGRELYELIDNLPTINVGSMERIIGLGRPENSGRSFAPVLAYKDDPENNRLLVSTNLVSRNEDLLPILSISPQS